MRNFQQIRLKLFKIYKFIIAKFLTWYDTRRLIKYREKDKHNYL